MATEHTYTPSWRRSYDAFLSGLAAADAHDIEPPSHTAIEQARRIGEILYTVNLPPDRVAPSVDGGIAIVFEGRTATAAIECYNSGEVVFAVSRRDGNPEVWETAADDRSILEDVSTLRGALQ